MIFYCGQIKRLGSSSPRRSWIFTQNRTNVFDLGKWMERGLKRLGLKEYRPRAPEAWAETRELTETWDFSHSSMFLYLECWPHPNTPIFFRSPVQMVPKSWRFPDSPVGRILIWTSICIPVLLYGTEHFPPWIIVTFLLCMFYLP